MKNNLTIVFSLYLDKFDMDYIYSLIPNSEKYDVVFINDNKSDYKFNWSINNGINYGKFFSIVNNIKEIKTNYFLTIDPDDVFLKNIDWKILENLSVKINESDFFDYGINSYIFIKKNKVKHKYCKKINVYFNPNIIFNKNNIEDLIKNTGIKFEKQKLTYFDDILLLLLSNNNGKKQYFDFPFYSYTANNGVTKNWKNFKFEIIYAKKIMNIILNNLEYKKIDKKIKKFRIARVLYLNKKIKNENFK